MNTTIREHRDLLGQNSTTNSNIGGAVLRHDDIRAAYQLLANMSTEHWGSNVPQQNEVFMSNPELPYDDAEDVTAPEDIKVKIGRVTKSFAKALQAKGEQDKEILEEAVRRVIGRLTRLTHFLDSYESRMSKLRELTNMMDKYDLVSRHLVKDIQVKEARDSVMLICKTNLVTLDLLLPTTGLISLVPVGEFQINIIAPKFTGSSSSAHVNGIERMKITIENTTTPAIVGPTRFDHPHVKNGEICWGDIMHTVIMHLDRYEFLPVLDYALLSLTSYNPGNAWRQLLDGWAVNMPEADRVCHRCMKYIIGKTISGRMFKCNCLPANEPTAGYGTVVSAMPARDILGPVDPTPNQQEEQAQHTLGDSFRQGLINANIVFGRQTAAAVSRLANAAPRFTQEYPNEPGSPD